MRIAQPVEITQYGGEIRSYLRPLHTSLAAALSTLTSVQASSVVISRHANAYVTRRLWQNSVCKGQSIPPADETGGRVYSVVLAVL